MANGERGRTSTTAADEGLGDYLEMTQALALNKVKMDGLTAQNCQDTNTKVPEIVVQDLSKAAEKVTLKKS